MKKVFTIALAASLLAGAAQAQEAFKHLGMSLEAGTTGLGVNLSYPLVTDHLVLTLGYNFPTFTIKSDADLSAGYVNGKIDQVNSMISKFNSDVDKFNQGAAAFNDKADLLASHGIAVNKLNAISPINENIDKLDAMKADLEAKLNFGNFKAFLEYYPTTKSYFHLTVGVMIGNEEWMNISAKVDDNTWGKYTDGLRIRDLAANAVNSYNNSLAANNANITEANALIDQYNQIPGVDRLNHLPLLPEASMPEIDDAAAVSLNGQTFVLDKNSGGKLDVAMKVKKVKPYLGVGFGSSVPTKHRCGCQFELGAYYQGTPTLESAQENPHYTGNIYRDKSIDELVKTIVHFQWYPQMTLRFTGRLF